MKLDLQVFTMHEIKNSVFYDYIEQYDQDTEYHFVGEIDYHLLENDKPYEGLQSHRAALIVVFDHLEGGHEWYGACCRSIYDKSMNRYVVMLVSATD